MRMDIELYISDMKRICNSPFVPWDKLKNRSVLVTGATGLIGAALVKALLYTDRVRGLNLTIYALVRDQEKAQRIFREQYGRYEKLFIVVHSDIQNMLQIEEPFDYIIHGANPTASSFFINKPVETSKTAFIGTMNMLDLANVKNVESMVFLSSMEVYGYPTKGQKVTEEDVGAFSTLKVRNCYPISKQMCENLCCSYYEEYGVPVKILRLTQTFGLGVDYEDNRVFAEFARCVIEKRNIVLKTKGLTERSYLDVSDAVTAILTVLLKGKAGQAYSVANEETYCSIYEMARMVAGKYGIDVMIEEDDISKFGYADVLYMDLDTTKIRELGWKAQVTLEEMYEKMIEGMCLE